MTKEEKRTIEKEKGKRRSEWEEKVWENGRVWIGKWLIWEIDLFFIS